MFVREQLSVGIICKIVKTMSSTSYHAGQITKLIAKLRNLKKEDELRQKVSVMMLQKLYNMGVINQTNNLTVAEHISAFLCLPFAVADYPW